jgi:capsular exopolysaccharide synthesis family protein
VARVWSSLKRYKWLILAIVVTGTSVGYALTRMVRPKYDVNATIWVARQPSSQGPVTAPGLLTDALSWTELARSFVVLDRVVARLGLYVEPADLADSLVFRGLLPTEALRAGPYTLAIDASGRSYTLLRRGETREEEDQVVERGAVGDSIGRSIGLLWVPRTPLLGSNRSLEFEVITPREAATRLNRDLNVNLMPTSNMMRLYLKGDQAGLLADKMNTLITVFVEEAARLKKENLSAVRATVQEQMDSAKLQLDRARAALETFKVNTITLPSEQTVVAPGIGIASNPVFTDYFNQNINYKNAIRDREIVQGILDTAKARDGRISIEALKSVPIATLINANLQTEIQQLETLQTQLRRMLVTRTDSHPAVVALRSQIQDLETKTIPELANNSLVQLRVIEDQLRRRIDGASSDLKAIPQRTIQEAALTSDVSVADRIYQDLQGRTVNARLAEMSALPDVSILDSAVAPRRPSSDTAPGIFLVAIAASVGFAVFLAVLLDRLDKRFRYPEQATNELGLDIMGAIPTITNPRNSSARLQEATQLVESFRSLSLSVRSAFNGSGPVQLTVSSPGPGDGKSFVSANLASALADGGYRTVLVDGDIRRGALHSVFAPMTADPGLLDYLAGEAALGDIVRSTQHGNLFVIPCGKRRRHGPELLAGEGMTALVRDLRGQFDAVILDSAPLGAGIDPYALGVASGAMLIVLRTGETDRKLAQAKLDVLDRMPVRILGTVLNDIGENPQFRYYYYLEGYAAVETGEQGALLGAGNGKGSE